MIEGNAVDSDYDVEGLLEGVTVSLDGATLGSIVGAFTGSVVGLTVVGMLV